MQQLFQSLSFHKEGNVCSPIGFKASASCGLRKNKAKKDLSCRCFGMLPPLRQRFYTLDVEGHLVTMERLKNSSAQAMLCNSGNVELHLRPTQRQ